MSWTALFASPANHDGYHDPPTFGSNGIISDAMDDAKREVRLLFSPQHHGVRIPSDRRLDDPWMIFSDDRDAREVTLSVTQGLIWCIVGRPLPQVTGSIPVKLASRRNPPLNERSMGWRSHLISGEGDTPPFS